MGEKETGLPRFCRDIARLTGDRPAAVRERYMALEQIGDVYYRRWLETGEILPEALEGCREARTHFEKAGVLEQEDET